MAFAKCLAGLLTVSAQDLELTVAPVGDDPRIVKTSAGSYPQTQDGDGSVTIRFGNLYSGEVRKVIVDVSFDAYNFDHDLEFLKVTYSYTSSSNSSSGGRERFVRTLNAHGDGVEEENTEVHAEKARQHAVELIQQATQQEDWPSQLQMTVEVQKMDMMENPLLTTELQIIHDRFADGVWGHSAYASSFVSSHNRQRSTARGSNAEIMRLFATPCMLLYHHQAMEFYNQSTLTATQDTALSHEKQDATQHSTDEHNRPPENYIFCQERVYEEYQPDETNTKDINTSQRPSGVFGIPISAATVIATGEYKEPITEKDVADYAMKMINADSKDIEAQKFVDNLKDRYGKGISAKCLIYNATGTTLDWVTYKDWFGCVYENYDPHYPSSIQNGQWGAFLHVQGFMSGSTSAVVYRTSSLCDWLFCWSIPLIGNNGVYTEIREEGHFPKHWQYIYDARLPKSSRSSTDTGYGYVSKSEISRGGTANVRAVFHLPY